MQTEILKSIQIYFVVNDVSPAAAALSGRVKDEPEFDGSLRFILPVVPEDNLWRYGRDFYRTDAIPVTQPTMSKH